MLLLQHMGELMLHLFNFFIDEQRVDSEGRLIDDSFNGFLAQFITRRALLTFENIITQHFAERLNRFILAFADFFGKGIIQFRKLPLFDFVQRYFITAFFSSIFLVAVILGNRCREFFTLTSLHANNVLIESSKEAGALLSQRKGVILQIRDLLIA